MPARLNQQFVKKQHRKYGYELRDDFVYLNNKHTVYCIDMRTGKEIDLPYIRLKQMIDKHKIKPYKYKKSNKPKKLGWYKSIYDINKENAINSPEIEFKSSFDKWVDKQSNQLKSLDADSQQIVYDSMQKYVKSLKHRKNFSIEFDPIARMNQFRGFVEAAKLALPKNK